MYKVDRLGPGAGRWVWRVFAGRLQETGWETGCGEQASTWEMKAAPLPCSRPHSERERLHGAWAPSGGLRTASTGGVGAGGCVWGLS